MKDWTGDDIAHLTALWASGLSTRKMGEAMHRPKNSIVGKAHRLGLPSRPSPINLITTPISIEERREHHAALERRRSALRRQGPTIPPLPSEAAAPVKFYTVALPPVAPPPVPPRRLPTTTHRFWLEPATPRPERVAVTRAAYAGISTCQFPRQVGTEFGGTTWLYCDAPATRGAYCEACASACYLGRRRAVVEAVAA